MIFTAAVTITTCDVYGICTYYMSKQELLRMRFGRPQEVMRESRENSAVGMRETDGWRPKYHLPPNKTISPPRPRHAVRPGRLALLERLCGSRKGAAA